jgi:hypothetical protein
MTVVVVYGVYLAKFRTGRLYSSGDSYFPMAQQIIPSVAIHPPVLVSQRANQPGSGPQFLWL